jgi:hypothetical protein
MVTPQSVNEWPSQTRVSGGYHERRIVKTIAVFDDFCHANDPHEEHDFDAFEAEGEIHSPCPSSHDRKR